MDPRAFHQIRNPIKPKLNRAILARAPKALLKLFGLAALVIAWHLVAEQRTAENAEQQSTHTEITDYNVLDKILKTREELREAERFLQQLYQHLDGINCRRREELSNLGQESK